MELSKNIFFNTDKLVPNSIVKISYIGSLFQDNSKEVYIHYGFGLLWENVSEVKMVKTELGFQAEIELQDFESFNFCFRNEINKWDNNDGKNYIFPIEKISTALSLIEDTENSSLSVHKGLRKSYIFQ